MSEIHPAIAAAQESWRCAQAQDKEGWLALMSEDVCIEDPIGVSPTNPTGKGVRGKAEVGEFFDKYIGASTIVVEVHESRFAGNESAHVMTLHTSLKGGLKTKVKGIFTYLLNDEGLLTNLRGYWTMDNMSFEHPPEKA
jgi:steroid delta-isomerase